MCQWGSNFLGDDVQFTLQFILFLLMRKLIAKYLCLFIISVYDIDVRRVIHIIRHKITKFSGRFLSRKTMLCYSPRPLVIGLNKAALQYRSCHRQLLSQSLHCQRREVVRYFISGMHVRTELSHIACSLKPRPHQRQCRQKRRHCRRNRRHCRQKRQQHSSVYTVSKV